MQRGVFWRITDKICLVVRNRHLYCYVFYEMYLKNSNNVLI